MIELEVIIQIKKEKLMEFSQSLTSIKPALELLCSSFNIVEVENTFTILMGMESVQELTTALCTKEVGVLSGAIKILADKSDIVIHTPGNKRRATDLHEVRSNYLKRKKKTITKIK